MLAYKKTHNLLKHKTNLLAMAEIITEASSKIYGELKKVVDRDMEVFYNPVMRINRDMTILILLSEAGKKQGMKIADPLAGSGIRSLRILREVEAKHQGSIKKIFVNDKKWKYAEYFEKNIELNKLTSDENEKILVGNEDANIFMLKHKVYDYIDIDPFGSPNPFLDCAIQSLRNKSILAITATDTSALCGSYPAAGHRKYWASPLRNELMHEFGVRILARKVQLVGGQYDKALTPIFSYAKEHYMKIFFRCENSKKKVDAIMHLHQLYKIGNKEYGPVWMGQLWDRELVEKMVKLSETEQTEKETKKLLSIINEECRVDAPFFLDMHQMSRQFKTGDNPRFDKIMESLKKEGFAASRTHFSDRGIKTNAPYGDAEKIFEQELIKINKSKNAA